jgi:hypothetical protein
MYMAYESSDYVNRSKVAKRKVQSYGVNCATLVTGMVPRLILHGEQDLFFCFQSNFCLGRNSKYTTSSELRRCSIYLRLRTRQRKGHYEIINGNSQSTKDCGWHLLVFWRFSIQVLTRGPDVSIGLVRDFIQSLQTNVRHYFKTKP